MDVSGTGMKDVAILLYQIHDEIGGLKKLQRIKRMMKKINKNLQKMDGKYL